MAQDDPFKTGIKTSSVGSEIGADSPGSNLDADAPKMNAKKSAGKMFGKSALKDFKKSIKPVIRKVGGKY